MHGYGYKNDGDFLYIDDAIEVLFGKLDEAINDIENGRVQTIEEAWKEIDSI